jgi:mannose-1-phosphate guanylyltransferase
VLTAGLGTRLRPLTDVRAKPAMPVGGEPLIRRIVAWLASHGVDDLVFNLHHRPETLTAVVGDGRDLAVRARYSWEQPRILGSAGGPRLALPLLAAERFFIINGDTLTDVNLPLLEAAHAESGARVTLALVPNREFLRYGGVQLDERQHIVGFTPRGASSEGSYHYVGSQIVEADVFKSLTPGEPASSIGGVYDALIASRAGAVRGFVCDAEFWDVGTTADYWRTAQAFIGRPAAAGPTIGRGTRIDETARVTRSILWDDVEVGRDAVVDECIITDRVVIPRGAEYRRVVIIRGEEDLLLVSPLFNQQS